MKSFPPSGANRQLFGELSSDHAENHNTRQTQSNGDMKQLVNCRRRGKKNRNLPVWAFIPCWGRDLGGGAGKGNSVAPSPPAPLPTPTLVEKKSVCCVKSEAGVEPTRPLGGESAGLVRPASSGWKSRHSGQTGIPMRSFFFFTVFKPLSRRTSSSSDSSISSSAENRI